MKTLLLASLLTAVACTSCVKQETTIDTGKKSQAVRLQTAEEYEVPVREGHVTQVSMNGTLLAEAVSPVTILIPKQSGSKAGEKRVPFVRPDERIPERYRNEKQYQTVPGSLFRRLPGRRLRLQRFRIPRQVPNAGKQVRIHHPADRAGFDQTDQTGLRRL